MRMFIKAANQPAFTFDEDRVSPVDISFADGFILTDNVELIAQLEAGNYEEITEDDPRWSWIVEQGWSRLSQLDYARQPTVDPEA